MKKTLFKTLAWLNRRILPRYSRRNLDRLGKVDKLIILYRYWVTRNAL